jgi:transcriptional regulator with XRE-family HTH domain
MKIAEMIRQALEQRGLHGLQEASEALGVSAELLRVTLNRGHIPKDKTLGIIANKLGLDRSVLIMAAYHEKVPVEVKGFLLTPSTPKYWRKKRVFPLSEEQCDYLAKIMSPGEIQMVRQLRQFPKEVQTHIAGYVDYVFASQRMPVTAGSAEE